MIISRVSTFVCYFKSPMFCVTLVEDVPLLESFMTLPTYAGSCSYMLFLLHVINCFYEVIPISTL
jgi:hypothetical protein